MFARGIAGMTDASATRRFWMLRSRQCWSTEEEHRLDVVFHPERWLLPELARHPARLHINLLAGYRGSGRGRELISTFLASVAAAGAASCHLAVRQANVNARRFYAKLGWCPVEVGGAEPGTYLAHPTG